jgi:ABC-type Co2+ transport system permease subunit
MYEHMVKRAVKYLIQGFAVAVAAFYIPKKMLKFDEIVAVAVTAAMTFAILDIFAPSVGSHARTGAGFGIGAGLVGF